MGTGRRATLVCAVVGMLLGVLTACSTEMDTGQRIQKAQESIENGDYRTALIELKGVLQEEPDNEEARYLLGKVYLPLGDGASAQKELEKARELGIAEEDLKLSLARSFYLQNKYQEALKWADSIQDAPAAVRAGSLVLKGEVFLATGETDKAEAAFGKAAELDPGSVEPALGRARVALARNRNRQASDIVDKVIESAPENAEARLLKAEILGLETRYGEAEESFAMARELAAHDQLTALGFRAAVGQVRMQLAQNKNDEALGNVNGIIEAMPRHPTPRFLRALAYYQKQEYEKALGDLQQAMRVTDFHMSSYMLMGAVQFALEHYEQASEYLTRVLNEVPSNPQARRLLAAVRMKQHQPEEALEVLESAEAQSDDAGLLAMMGNAALFSGELERSEKYYKRAIEQSPEDSKLRAALANVYLRKGAIGQAISELESIKGDGEKQAQVMVVLANLRRQDYRRAEEIAEQLAGRWPEDPAMQILLGGVAQARGALNEARQHYEEALAIESDYHTAWLNIGRLELARRELAEAADAFDRVLQLDEGNVPAMMGLAQVAEQQGDMEVSLSWVRKALEKDPESVTPYLVLGRYHAMRQEWDEARDLLGTAAEKHPGNAGVLLSLGQVQLGMGKFGDAVSTFEKLVALEPESSRAYVLLANAQKRAGLKRSARETLERAADKLPQALDVSVALAMLKYDLGDKPGALDIARELARNAPDNPVGQTLIGDIHVRAGDYEAAGRAYESAWDISPSKALLKKRVDAYEARGANGEAVALLEDWVGSHPEDLSTKLLLAVQYQKADQAPRAEKLYMDVLEDRPENVLALNNLGWLYFTSDDPRARQYAEKAYKLAPESVAVADTYAWILISGGEIDKGKAILGEVIDKTASPDVHYHYAVALSESGQKEEARRYLEPLTAENVEFGDKAKAVELLNRL